MPQCFVLNCGNYYNKTRGRSKVIYHMLPSCPALALKWIEVCGIKTNTKLPHTRICSEHFSENCYQRDLQHELLGLPLRKKLKGDAIPDKNLPNANKNKTCLRKNPANINKIKSVIASSIKTETNKQTNIINNKQTTLAMTNNKNNLTKLLHSSKSSGDNKNKSDLNKINSVKIPINKTTSKSNRNIKGVNHNVVVINETQKENSKESKINKARNSKENILNNRILKRSNENINSTKEKDIKKERKLRNSKEISESVGVEINKKDNECDLKDVKKVIKSRKIKEIIKIDITDDVMEVIEISSDNSSDNNSQVKRNSAGMLTETLILKNNLIDSSDKEQKRQLKRKCGEMFSRSLDVKTNREIPGLQEFSSPNKRFNKLNTTNKSPVIITSTPNRKLLNVPKIKPILASPRTIESFEFLKMKNDIMLLTKSNDKFNRLPMRSSIRIAKKKSIESLSDSFSSKINNTAKRTNKRESFGDKLKFMAKLQLKFERNENSGVLLNHSLAAVLSQHVQNDSLNKMRIMEDVREGCNIQPSSPGHAEQRTNNDENSKDDHAENGYCDNEDETKNNMDLQEEEIKSLKDEEKKKDEEIDEDTLGNDKQESQDSNNHVLNNDESYSNESSPENNQSNKRKSENFDSAIKKLRLEIEDSFTYRDKIISDYLEISDCNNVDQIQIHSDQILSEVKTLNDLAREKEREWNNIIHLKKLKEELLLRMQRRKQILMLSGGDKHDGEYLESQSEYNSGSVNKNFISNQSILKANLINPQKHKSLSHNKFKNILPRPPQQCGNNILDMNGSDFRQGRQRPVLDVQSIIADYRQRHPEVVPRRGRRIRNNHNSDSKMSSNGVMNFASLSLGSGAQVRQNLQGLDVNSELGMLLSAMEGSRQENSRPTSADSNPISSGPSFKDMLVEFAKLSQTERNELLQNIKPPPPYPEVTVHPVPTTTVASPPTNSLLHGILTKSPTKSNSKSSFSPTLARLLTAPERAAAGHATSTPTITSTTVNPGNMSISEILSTSKARNEITITPVGQSFDATNKSSRHIDEEEAEDSADRLVIDESTENSDARRGDSNSDAGDEVPQCQGCNQKPAQFVCAGCGNQWYCSRDCQVSAWDEHSEVCSG